MGFSLFQVLLISCLTSFVLAKHHHHHNHHHHHHGKPSDGSSENNHDTWNATERFMHQIQNEEQLGLGKCQELVKCNKTSEYRTFDGTCNNPLHGDWGSVDDCLLRFLPAGFVGYDGIRQSVKGGPLPAPDDLAQNLLPDMDETQHPVSSFFGSYGEALVRDIASDISYDDMETEIKCCPDDPSSKHCKSTIFLPGGTSFSQIQSKCLSFVNSSICSSASQNSPRSAAEQCAPIMSGSSFSLHLNSSIQYTSATFGSGCFSASESNLCDAVSNACRINSDKQLCCPPGAFSDSSCLPVLMDDGSNTFTQCNVECSKQQRALPCTRCKADKKNFPNKVSASLDLDFVYGLSKEQSDSIRDTSGKILLDSNSSSISTVLKKEHNRVASQLHGLNPHWDDERLFQEARKIVCGKWQSITYGSYLPILLPPSEYVPLGLPSGNVSAWDPDTRLGVFVAAALGFNFLPLMNPNSMNQYKQQENAEEAFATTIYEYRDHGLPPYTAALKYCSGGRIRIGDFDDLHPVMSDKNIKRLQDNYEDVRDVDWIVGILLEDGRVDSSVLSYTAACLSARQFYTLKFGDRFYFEHVALVNSFTRAQIEVLRKTELSKLLCDNSGIKSVTRNPFLPRSNTNPLVSCSSLANDDLSPWKEASPSANDGKQGQTTSVPQAQAAAVTTANAVSVSPSSNGKPDQTTSPPQAQTTANVASVTSSNNDKSGPITSAPQAQTTANVASLTPSNDGKPGQTTSAPQAKTAAVTNPNAASVTPSPNAKPSQSTTAPQAQTAAATTPNAASVTPSKDNKPGQPSPAPQAKTDAVTTPNAASVTPSKNDKSVPTTSAPQAQTAAVTTPNDKPGQPSPAPQAQTAAATTANDKPGQPSPAPQA